MEEGVTLQNIDVEVQGLLQYTQDIEQLGAHMKQLLQEKNVNQVWYIKENDLGQSKQRRIKKYRENINKFNSSRSCMPQTWRYPDTLYMN